MQKKKNIFKMRRFKGFRRHKPRSVPHGRQTSKKCLFSVCGWLNFFLSEPTGISAIFFLLEHLYFNDIYDFNATCFRFAVCYFYLS